MRLFVYLLMFCFFSGIVSFHTDSTAEPVPADDIDRLRANVLALDRVQNNIHKEIDSRIVAATISIEENNELLIFARYLQDRNRKYCSQLQQLAGHGAVADLPCPEERVALPEAKAKTLAEEVTELDQILAESLGAFDEMLLKEQEMVASRQPRQRESGGGGTTGRSSGGGEGRDGKSGKAGSEESGQHGAGEQDHGQTATTTAAGKPGQADGQTGNVSGRGRNKLNADDDIVARQLREAAEKETDPELKEKLWDEYRKYKAGG